MRKKQKQILNKGLTIPLWLSSHENNIQKTSILQIMNVRNQSLRP